MAHDIYLSTVTKIQGFPQQDIPLLKTYAGCLGDSFPQESFYKKFRRIMSLGGRAA